MILHLRRSFRFSPDGIQVITYERGEHDLPEEAAKIAIRNGFADEPKPAKRVHRRKKAAV